MKFEHDLRYGLGSKVTTKSDSQTGIVVEIAINIASVTIPGITSSGTDISVEYRVSWLGNSSWTWVPESELEETKS